MIEVPDFPSLVAKAVPPRAFMMLITMESPRPEPPAERVWASSPRKNRSKTWGKTFSGMPGPLSQIKS